MLRLCVKHCAARLGKAGQGLARLGGAGLGWPRQGLSRQNQGKESEMRVKVQMKGVTALLMHNVRLANPLDAHAKELKKLSGIRKKTEDIYEQMAHLEYLGGLYISERLGPYLQGNSLHKAWIEGARLSKNGKQVERGVLIDEYEVPLLYKGPRTAEELWKNENHRDVSMVRVQSNRLARCRPKFPAWELETAIELDEEQLNLDIFQRVGSDGGRYIGIGDGRNIGFGRYEFSVTKA